MPVYEYVCRDCSEISEFRESLVEKEKNPERTCPQCGGKNMEQYYGNMIVIASTHLH